MPDWGENIRARLSSLHLSPAREAEIVDELSQHLEDRYRELRSGGASPAEAERVALREFRDGNVLAEQLSTLRHVQAVAPLAPAAGRMLQEVGYTVRMAVRGLWKDSGFAATAIFILTLGLAVNVTAFRIMDATLFHGYPFVHENERMMFIDERFPFPGCCVSYADFDAWQTEAKSFQGLTFGVLRQASLEESADETRDVTVTTISANALEVLGVVPALGRDFRPSDETPGSAPAVMVSHRYWMARWAGHADVVGSIVRVNGSPATVVGVLPRGFEFPQRSDIWMPLQLSADLPDTVANGSFVFGRLADGVSEAMARAEIEAINARLAAEFPATNRDVRPVLTSFMDSYAGPNARVIYGSLWVAGWLVLAIAIANVANLAVARAQSRTRETCTRLALGAGRGRLAGQWFAESLLLAAAAGLFAWILVTWGTQFWTAATQTPYQTRDFTPTLFTLAYLVVVAIGTAIVVVLAPAGRLWRLEVDGVLKGDARGATINLRAKRLAAALVAGQMMLAIVLMSGAGVLGHSVWNVMRTDVGVQAPKNVLIGRLDLPGARYRTEESRAAFFAALRERLIGIPGVASAAVANGRPVDDHEPRPVEAQNLPGAANGAPVFSSGPGYFETVGAPLLVGRDFTAADGPASTPVAIVNRSFAETYFPGQDAVGQRIRLYGKREAQPGEWRTIVGVVSNIMQNDAFRRRFRPAVYVPFAQEATNYGWFFVRARDRSEALPAAVRQEAQRLDSSLELQGFMTLEASLGFALDTRGRGGPGSAEYAAFSRHAAVAPVFAVIALLLAAAGLYAVVARSVGQRTKEIGVRMALGAARPAIRRLVLLEGMAPVALGLVLGLAASLAVNRVFESQLVGVSPYDALTLTLAPLILAVVALLGCLLPLRQAVRVDPAVALRRD